MARLRAASSESIRSDVAHLLRRSGFGAPTAKVDALTEAGYDAAVETVVAGLTAPDPSADAIPAPTFDTSGYLAAITSDDVATKQAARRQARTERQALVGWWVRRMVASDH